MSIKNKIFKPGLVAFGISLAALSLPTNAGLKDELNSMFSEMSNVTQPGVHESQRRGVVFGGRLVSKNRIINQNVVSFVPPSIKAGCGGIDMFGGSFSFINSEQLVQLMRAVAQNAIGYAFQLALDAVCPVCSKHMAYLQDQISKLNQYLGNSCQLAQGLVDGGYKAMTEGFRKDEETKSTDSGIASDSFKARTSPTGTDLSRDKPSEYAKLIGNVTWNELQKNRVGSWFRHGDTNLMEAMLSISGSVIVGNLVDDPNPAEGSSAGKTNNIFELQGNVLNLEELVFGSSSGRQVRMYDCSADTTTCAGSDGSTPPHTKEVSDFTGLNDRILTVLLGNASNVGLVAKYARPELALSSELTTSEKALLTSMPGGIGGMIRNLSQAGEDAARDFVAESSALIALEMSYSLATELMRAVTASTASSNSAFATKVTDIYEKSSRVLAHERQILTERHGRLSDVMERYSKRMELSQRQRYSLSNITSSSKK